MRTWFRGTAYYGQALCEARLGDTQSAKKSISTAAELHFWDFALIAEDSALRGIVGEKWIDSVEAYWDNVRIAEMGVWPSQGIKVIRPQSDSLYAPLPVIIALHGGNASYEEFAEYWPQIAEALHVLVIVPPGISRISDVTNSWGYDVPPVEKMLVELVQSMKAQHIGDSNRIYLAGFSQGAQMTIEVGLKHSELFFGLVSICGFAQQVPDSLMLSHDRQNGIRLYMLCAEHENHRFEKMASEVGSALNRASVPLRMESLQGSLHEMPLDFIGAFSRAWKWLNESNESNVVSKRGCSHRPKGSQ
jgi:predicted esterase